MPSATYAFFRRAILERKLDRLHRIRASGAKSHRTSSASRTGREALVFQFGGETNSTLPPGGEWRCFTLDRLSAPRR